MVMQAVIAREEYEKLNSITLRSVIVKIGFIYATIIFVILTLESALVNGGRPDRVSEMLINLTQAVVSGVVFCLFYIFLIKILDRRIMNKAYASMDNENSEKDAELTFFLPCSFVKSRRLAIGGTLYFGDTDIVFVPHKFNLGKHKKLHIKVFRHEITAVKTVEQTKGLFTKLLTCRDLQLVQLETAESEYRFLTQKPEFVAEFVRGYVCK